MKQKYNSENSPFQIRNILKEEMPLVAELGNERYGDRDISFLGRVQKFTEWYRKRNDVFRVLVFNDSIIGYQSVIPLRDGRSSIFQSRYEGGNVDEFEIPATEIAKGKTTRILYQGGHIHPTFLEHSEAVNFMWDGLYQFIASFMYPEPNSIAKTIIYTEPIHNDHITVLREIGFTPAISNKDRVIYEINFNENSRTQTDAKGKEAIKRIYYHLHKQQWGI